MKSIAGDRFAADDVRAHAQYMLDSLQQDSAHCDKLIVNPVGCNLLLPVPILGTIVLERKVFGEIRRNGVIGDWILGGLVPAALGITSLAVGRRSERASRSLGYMSLGFYIGGRLLVFPPANHHIFTFNNYVRQSCKETL